MGITEPRVRVYTSDVSRPHSFSSLHLMPLLGWVVALAVNGLWILFNVPVARADAASVLPAFFAEPGSHDKWRQNVSGINESVDPFGGSLQVSHTDMVVPGQGGLDIVIQRHYTSNIFLSRGSPLSNPPYPSTLLTQSPAGMGWTLHFGRAVKSQSYDRISNHICSTSYDPNLGDTTLDDGVLELPDGSMDTLVTSTTGAALFATRKNWLANCTPTSDGLIVYAPNGLKYTMNHAVSSLDDVTYTTRITTAWHTTRIEDANGNYINISYSGQRGSYALISQITSNDGREVNFTYINGYLSTVTANNQTWIYTYNTVGSRTYLASVVRPDGLTWQYDYYPSGSTVANVLRQITYPYGATVTYTYGYADFMGDPAIQGWDNSGKMFSVVVTSKIQGGQGVEPGTWAYTYAPASDSSIEPPFLNDVTTVDYPGGRYIYRHYGMQRQLQIPGTIGDRQVWKTGLLKEKEIYSAVGSLPSITYNLLQKETYDWIAPGSLSTQDNVALVYPVFDQDVFYPQMTKKTILRDGTSYVTDYTYDLVTDSRPIKTVEQQTSPLGNEATRTTDLYWYPASPSQVWLFDQILHEVVDNNNYFGTLREFDYATGNLTALQPLGVVERYTYDANGNRATKLNARGWTTQFNNYHRGIPRQEIHPVTSTATITTGRTVNDTGTVSSETNGRAYTTSFQYDDLNRPILIDKPIGADTTVSWDATGRTVTRGNYRERTEYDGFGRTICVDVADTVRNEHVIQTTRYNALGFKVFTSYPFGSGSCSAPGAPAGDNIVTDVLGRVINVSHPDGTSVTNEYRTGNQTAVTNERGQVTVYFYRSFGDPDNARDRALLRIDAPENVSTVFTRNVIGQILNVTQGTRQFSGGPITNGVARSYTYDPIKNFLLTATNPETGVSTYTRDGLGNMTSRTVNGSPVTNYVYDAQERLRTIDYPASMPDVSLNYDANNNLSDTSQIGALLNNDPNIRASRSYIYNENDSLTSESLRVEGAILIAGFPAITDDRTLTAQYAYNNLDQLTSITYPSTRVVTFNPDARGWAREVGSFVTNVAYHPTGQPSSISYGNGLTTTLALNNRQWTSRIATSGGLVDLTYGYDGRGNIHSISDAVDSQYSRSLDYDGLDRLTTANGVWGTGTIAYDAVGNIRSKALGADSLTYAYDGANRLTGVSGSRAYNYSYDVYGNIISNNVHLFTYDDASNLANVSGASSASYFYDGKNMRVREVQGGAVTYHLYAKNGQLLGEYDRDTSLHREYAYLGGKLVAMVLNNQAPTVSAGTDQVVYEGVNVTLTGAASDSDGVIASYQWTQTVGPAVALSGANSSTATFTAPLVTADTILTFQLTVIDNGGAIATATTNVTVRNVVVPDAPPTASISVYPGNSQNTISWGPVAGSPTYNLYWSTSLGVTKATGNLISNVTSPYLHTGIVNGTRYYYIVTAVVGGVESVESAEFSAIPGSSVWGPVSLVSSSMTGDGNPLLAVYPDGASMLVYSLSGQVWANYRQPDGTWLPPVDISEVGYWVAYNGNSALAVSSNGDAIAVSAVNNVLYAKRFTRSAGWGPRTPVSDVNTTQRMHEVSLAMDPSGNAMALWRESCCNGVSSYSIKARRFDAATQTWGTTTLMGSGGSTTEPRAVFAGMDNSGNALAVWGNSRRYLNQFGASYSIYNATAGAWGTTQTVTDNYTLPKAAMSGNGSAVVVYLDSADSNILARHYTPSSGWQAPISILSKTPGTGGLIGVAMDGSGNAMALRYRNDTTSAPKYLYGLRYMAGTGWDQTPVQVADISPNVGTLSDMKISMNSSGQAIVSWLEGNDATYSVWAAHYASGWRAPLRIVEVDRGSTYPDTMLQVSSSGIDASGNAVMTWGRCDANPSISGAWLCRMWNANYAWLGSAYSAPNGNPRAYAGYVSPIDVAEGALLALDGTKSHDPDGTVASNQWSQFYTYSSSNTAVVPIQNANSPIATITAPIAAGNIYFKNVVTDQFGATGTDTVMYRINGPIASACCSSVPSEGTVVTLTGSGTLSGYGGSAIVAYQWTQTAGPSIVLYGADTNSLSFVAPHVTSSVLLVFKLTVTDDLGGMGSTFVSVSLNASAATNQFPTANAGQAQTVNQGAAVTLTGSGNDPDGTIASYSWTQTAGPAVTLNGANTATATFTAPQVPITTTLTFRLVVTDNLGKAGMATTTVSVSSSNQAPTANAGADQIVNKGATVSLSGSGGDPDGTIASYSWIQISGPAVTLGTPNAAATTFTAPLVSSATVLTFRLTVTDNLGATRSATTNVTVHNVNLPPTASAGTDQAVNDGTTVSLIGSGTDSDGTISVYQWTQTAGPAVTLSNANAATATFVAPIVTADTVLTFRLTVTDNQGATGSATTNVTVHHVNQPPTANAGPDQPVNENTAVILPGSGSDTDGTITSYAWTQIAGLAVTLNNANTATASFAAPAVTADTALTFRLTVTDNSGATATDDVTVTVRNVIVTFPQVASITTSTFGTNTTAHAVTMPVSVSAGDLLLILVTSDGSANQTTPSGWTALFLNQRSGTAVTFSAFTKVATGTEGGTTINVATSATEQAAAQVYRITNWYGSLTGVVSSASVTGTSTGPNPSSLAPSWGAANTLWIATHAYDHDGTRTTTAYPANFTNGSQTQSNTGAGAVHVAAARRAFNATSQNPGAFTVDVSDNWVARTIAIRPAP